MQVGLRLLGFRSAIFMLGLFLSSSAWAAKVLVLEDNFDGNSLSNIWVVMKIVINCPMEEYEYDYEINSSHHNLVNEIKTSENRGFYDHRTLSTG